MKKINIPENPSYNNYTHIYFFTYRNKQKEYHTVGTY